MYDNNSFNFDTDFKCYLRNSKDGEIVETFGAREIQQLDRNASFVGGGIISGGHNYGIATTYNFKNKIVPYKDYVEVDGVNYKVSSVSTQKIATKGISNYKKTIETTIYLG